MLIGKFGSVKDQDPVLPPATLYGGEVQVCFDPVAHKYTVTDVCVNGGVPFSPPSVTRVLSAMIDKSEPLVAWATRVSREKVIELVQPGRTYTAEEIQRISYEVQAASKAVVKAACDTGHSAHAWIERYLSFKAGKGAFPAPPVESSIRSACAAAQKFIRANNIVPVSVERILYHRIGVIGTCDLAGSVALVNGCLSILDWKTSNSIEDHHYEWQLAAYSKMYEAMCGVPVPGRVIVRLDKENKTAYPKVLPPEELEKDWAGFLGLLAAKHRILEMEQQQN